MYKFKSIFGARKLADQTGVVDALRENVTGLLYLSGELDW